MYAGEQSRANGGGGDGGRDALLRRRRQPGPSSSSSTSGKGAAAAAAAAAAAGSSSSSGRAEEAEEEGGGKKLWGRRKRQGKREAVARAILDGLPAAAASCWRGVTVVEETGTGRRGRSRLRNSAADGSVCGGDTSGEGGSDPGAAAWCCVCPAADCSLEPNPSANGKEDPGVRSLLERNDFFAADCNPHADGIPSSSSSR